MFIGSCSTDWWTMGASWVVWWTGILVWMTWMREKKMISQELRRGDGET
jgi:hypothetical protein